ncbi:hypothetical protein LguiA_024547 [Lonicera macranthoides]
MGRVSNVIRKGRKAIKALDLLKVLQSEITHEASFPRFQNEEGGSLGDFVLEWDSPKAQDVVLRKKCDSGEEVAVSALLGNETFDEDASLPREALMKVCIKKPALGSILQFDCGVSAKGYNASDFDIKNAYYLQQPTCFDSSVYRGPLFSTLDPQLQDELKQYLVARGIEESLTNFLLLHLHRKEQDQYVNWLHKLVSVVMPSE